MKTKRHTPGPWHNSNGNIYADEVFLGMTWGVPIGDSLANADLMAAAPEMYNLLYSLRELVSDANVEIIDEVLTRAEGNRG